MAVDSIYIKIPTANIKSLYEFDGEDINHALLNGITRSGKSSTLRQLVLRYIEYGYTVVWREVGKMDFISRFQTVQDVIDFYASKYYLEYSAETELFDQDQMVSFWKDYQKNVGNDLVVVIDHPSKIQQHKVNILTFDIMNGITSRIQVIVQYYYFFKKLRIDRELTWEDYDLVIFVDEANYIMPTYGKISLSKQTFAMLTDMIGWMNQWAGYHVRFLLSTHVLYELNKDARSMCGLILFKMAERKDSKELMQHELFHLSNEDFLALYKQLQSLPPGEVLYIDKSKEHQVVPVPWHERKYNVKDCRHFIDSFNVKPIVKPIDRSWKEVKRITNFLFSQMEEDDIQRIFYDVIDEETNKITTKIKIHQFYDFLFRYDDFQELFGDNEFLKEYLIRGVMVYYENHNLEEKVDEKQQQKNTMLQIRDAYIHGQLDTMEAVILTLEIDPHISNKKLAEYLDLPERGPKGASKLKVKYQEKKYAHTHDIINRSLSLLEYYRLTKNMSIEETPKSNPEKQSKPSIKQSANRRKKK